MISFLFLKKKITTLKFFEFSKIILIIFIPNFIFLLVAFFTVTSRPLINIDYLIALLFLFSPWKLMRLSGVVLFILAMLFDTVMFIIQIFPFMDFAAIRYLSSFISIAPKNYLAIFIGFLICMGIILWGVMYLSKITARIYAIFMIVVLLVITSVFMQLRITYAEFQAILGRNNYFIAHSQMLLYQEITKSQFWDESNIIPKLAPLQTKQQRAANYLQQPSSSKILYIVAESWGALRNNTAQNLVMQNIIKQKENLEFINYGSFYTVGSTVAGELRELCNLELLNNGFAFSRLEKEKFSSCLPKKFAQNGYKTIALHGTSGLLYDRTDWYVKAGFQETLFGEHFIGLPRCRAFNGICDNALVDVIVDKFSSYSQQNLFFYWMTLSSHQPYSEKDIYNRRFKCEAFNMQPKGEICRNTRLETQFLDNIAELIQKPQMKGVEVIIVGDHQPPIFGYDIEYVHPLTVSYLHFKVK